MSHRLINRSPDLKRLRDEGYDLEIRSGFLLVKSIPYVNSRKEVRRGTLVTTLALAGDVTTRPDTHVVFFAGEYPCRADGTEIEQIRHGSGEQAHTQGVVTQHSFSAKPKPSDRYPDYYAKMSTYAALLSGPAQAIDSTAKPQTFPAIPAGEDAGDTPFRYIDTASSRAGIDLVTGLLAQQGKVVIVGLGGTGSYVLDLVAKTPVGTIHLYDGDTFLQHNAFRSPGAPSLEELQPPLPKVTWFKNMYSKMHAGIVDHAVYLDAENVEELRDSRFVFLCIDSGESKKLIVEKLEEFNVPFTDVGMGVQLADSALGGIVRATTSTPAKRDHFRTRVSLAGGEAENEYAQNIQIADLNALNAALAVIKWKKLVGFYRDLKSEHHSQYSIDSNLLVNDDRPQ